MGFGWWLLLYVALGWRLYLELLIFQHQIKVLILSGYLRVISKLIDTVPFYGFLSFKVLMHGGNIVISTWLSWFSVVMIEMTPLSAVKVFISGIILCIS